MAVTLDFSKAQPLEKDQDQDGGVKLDFSKAQPLHAESSSVSPIPPPPMPASRINVHPSYLIGDPDADATPRSVVDQLEDMGKNIFQSSTPGIVSSIARHLSPGALSKHGWLGSWAEKNATPVEHLPSQLATNLAMYAIPGGEAEAGGAGEVAAARPVEGAIRPRPRISVAPATESAEASTMAGRAASVARRRIGNLPGVKAVKDADYIFRGDRTPPAEAPPASVPQTNGIEWGTGGAGPLDLRGKMIPPEMTPAEPAPVAPRWRDATHVNEPYAGEAVAPTEVAPVPKGAPTYRDATITRRNIPDFAGEEETPKPTAALALAPVEPSVAVSPVIETPTVRHASRAIPKPAEVEQMLNESLGGSVPPGHTPVKSTAIRSYKYDPATQEFEASTSSGTYIHGDVTPEQAKAFEDASSKGKAWVELKKNSTYVGKIVNGKRVSAIPPRNLRSGVPDVAEPSPAETTPAIRLEKKPPKPALEDSLMDQLKESLKRARSKQK